MNDGEKGYRVKGAGYRKKYIPLRK